jgi:hypothetical protein
VAERRITAILSTLVSTDVSHLYTATTSEGGECRWATYRRDRETRRTKDAVSSPAHLRYTLFAPYPLSSMIPAALTAHLRKRRE